jgi:hypothetical protein
MIMQDNDTNSTPDNELPPIEGELTDEDLEHVSGGCGGAAINGTTYFFPRKLLQGNNDNAQGNNDCQ